MERVTRQPMTPAATQANRNGAASNVNAVGLAPPPVMAQRTMSTVPQSETMQSGNGAPGSLTSGLPAFPSVQSPTQQSPPPVSSPIPGAVPGQQASQPYAANGGASFSALGYPAAMPSQREFAPPPTNPQLSNNGVPSQSVSGLSRTNTSTATYRNGSPAPGDIVSNASAPVTGSTPNDQVAKQESAAKPVAPLPSEIHSGTLVAVVGADHILAGDLASYVEPVIEKNRERIRSSLEEDRLRVQILRQALKHYVEIKAMYQEFFRDSVGAATPDKREELQKKVVTKARQIFYEKQVTALMKKNKVNTLGELEEKLQERSMSLSTMQSAFIEQILAAELERKYVPDRYEIARQELVDYYRKNQTDWDVPARAKWQQITIRFDKHDYDRAAVERRIKELGDEVFLGGKAFEAVAKQFSEGYSADEGGYYDWTNQGSLKSKPLDKAIFSIPLGRMSQVITDEIGMHIIVVHERSEKHTKAFTEAQQEIRETLSEQRRNEELAEFRSKILARTPVWSLWPDDLKDKVKNVRPLQEAVGQ